MLGGVSFAALQQLQGTEPKEAMERVQLVWACDSRNRPYTSCAKLGSCQLAGAKSGRRIQQCRPWLRPQSLQRGADLRDSLEVGD
jgi:hypothetical protein